MRPLSLNSRNGSALLVVLLMLGIIASLVSVVSRSLSGAALELSAARSNSLATSDLRAGIELGVAAILRLGDKMRSGEASAELSDRRISVRVTNERARIDLNAASAPVLTALFKANGIDEREAGTLADSVVEWRGGAAAKKSLASADASPTASPSLGLGPAVTRLVLPQSSDPQEMPKQKPGVRYFFEPAQLISVPGLSKSVVKSVYSLLTVANGSNKIDPFIADEMVLNSMPDSTQSKVEGFITTRGGNTSRETALLMLGLDQDLVTADAALGWRVQITTARRSGRPFRSEAVIAVLKGDDVPYRVLYVIDDPDQYTSLKQH